MTTGELNAYLLHYLKFDRTQTAVMLTGEWGSGKTYYVENELRPFLEKNASTVVVVSLYGLNDVSEISKSVYMELRMPTLSQKRSELVTTGKVIARNVLKNITGLVGINFNLDDDSLKKLYESVNLKDKLLVFEDVERGNISVSNLLGYVNGLVERDGAKVLLVANENEILKKDEYKFKPVFLTINNDTKNENDEAIVPEEIKTYLRIKEKTISDTIRFNGDLEKAIIEIVKNFDNDLLNSLFSRNKALLNSVSNVVSVHCHRNLRTFIYAIQKTVDILNKIDTGSFDEDYYECLLVGNLYLSSRLKADDFPVWEGNEYLSTKLGTNEMPVMRFSYDYIRWQTIDVHSVEKTYEAFKDFRFFERNAEYKDADIRVLMNYATETEEHVLSALKNIEKKLKEPDTIGIRAYCKLAYYLIYVGTVVGFDYKPSCDLMLKNAKGLGQKANTEADIHFAQTYEIEEKEIKKKYTEYISRLSEALSYEDDQIEFSYRPTDVGDLYTDICRNASGFIVGHRFLSRYDLDKLVDMLATSTSGQIHDFRGVLYAVYRNAGQGDFDEKDVAALKKLLEKVKEKNKEENNWDRIQLLQMKYLMGNLEGFITQMT